MGHQLTQVILNLGVHDMAYAAQFHTKAGKVKKGVSKAQAAYGAGKTTGDIALLLEARYHVMQTFFDMEKETIAKAIVDSMSGAIVNMALGQPGPINPLNQAMSGIQSRFQAALSARAFDGKTSPGKTPTTAAERGVSHRFKKPYARRAARPSFIDTGLYQSSFTAWTET